MICLFIYFFTNASLQSMKNWGCREQILPEIASYSSHNQSVNNLFHKMSEIREKVSITAFQSQSWHLYIAY